MPFIYSLIISKKESVGEKYKERERESVTEVIFCWTNFSVDVQDTQLTGWRHASLLRKEPEFIKGKVSF